MKAIEIVKRNMWKIALVAVSALVLQAGVIAPLQVANAQTAEIIQPRAKQAQVLHRYKYFTNGVFVDPKYDTEVKIYMFPNELIYLGDTHLGAAWGRHPNGATGVISQYQCNYDIR